MTHVILYIIEFNDTCVICHGVQRHMLYYISLSSMTHVKLDSTEFNDTCYTIYHWVHWHMLFAMESKDTCYTLYAGVQWHMYMCCTIYSVDTCATYKCTHVLLQC